MTDDLSRWQVAAAREVKGADLAWRTPEGLAIKPLYTAADTADLDPGLPGFRPPTRAASVRRCMRGGRGRSGNMRVFRRRRSPTPFTGVISRRGSGASRSRSIWLRTGATTAIIRV